MSLGSDGMFWMSTLQLDMVSESTMAYALPEHIHDVLSGTMSHHPHGGQEYYYWDSW